MASKCSGTSCRAWRYYLVTLRGDPSALATPAFEVLAAVGDLGGTRHATD